VSLEHVLPVEAPFAHLPSVRIERVGCQECRERGKQVVCECVTCVCRLVRCMRRTTRCAGVVRSNCTSRFLIVAWTTVLPCGCRCGLAGGRVWFVCFVAGVGQQEAAVAVHARAGPCTWQGVAVGEHIHTTCSNRRRHSVSCVRCATTVHGAAGSRWSHVVAGEHR